MIKRGKGSWAVLTFIVWGAVVTAEPPTPVASEQEFLEFLSGWELEDGTWVNPLEFLGPDDEQITDEPFEKRLPDPHSHNSIHDQPTPTQNPEATTQP